MASSPFIEQDRRPVRLWLVPTLSIVCGSLLGVVPIVATNPWWPAWGLLMALGWRLLRPELWMAWMALPLGLADDLIGGAPLGSAALLWTITFLVLDIPDRRMVYRAFGDEWQLAIGAIAFVTAGQWGIALFTGGTGPAWTILPQFVIGILCFPMALRICAMLDRWRLRRGAAIAP